MSPVLPTPVSPMNTMFSALGMNSSCASVRIWRSLTPFCSLKGKDSRVQGSLKCARWMRASSACSCRACHSARSSCATSVGTGVPLSSAAASISSKRAATVLSFKFSSNCCRSSFIARLRLEREHEVVVRDLLEHHLLEPIQVKESIPLGKTHGAQEGLARILLQHGEQPAQRRTSIPDLMLQRREVARQTRLELQHPDLLRRRLRAAGEPLAARRTVRGVGHAHIPWPVLARMARHP